MPRSVLRISFPGRAISIQFVPGLGVAAEEAAVALHGHAVHRHELDALHREPVKE